MCLIHVKNDDETLIYLGHALITSTHARTSPHFLLSTLSIG